MERAPDRKTAVLPDSVDNDGVVISSPLFEPWDKARRVSVLAATWPERVSDSGKFFRPGIVRWIERNRFDLMTAPAQHERRLPDRLERTAHRRSKRVNAL